MSAPVFSPRTTAFLADHAERLGGVAPEAIVERIESLVAYHDAWRGGVSPT